MKKSGSRTGRNEDVFKLADPHPQNLREKKGRPGREFLIGFSFQSLFKSPSNHFRQIAHHQTTGDLN
jgi:hypothetical protein